MHLGGAVEKVDSVLSEVGLFNAEKKKLTVNIKFNGKNKKINNRLFKLSVFKVKLILLSFCLKATWVLMPRSITWILTCNDRNKRLFKL